MRAFCLIPLCLALAGCFATPEPRAIPRVDGKAPIQVRTAPRPDGGVPRVDGRTAVRNFIAVVAAVEPVATRLCQQSPEAQNCNYRIVVDDAVNAPPNAFQTLDADGRPVIAFTIPLIAEARNRDEMAFIMAHEAAHHILGHLLTQRRNAAIGAGALGTLASILDPGNVEQAQAIGAQLGARTYSKEFELEADALGARITLMAGYDPVAGAAFFARIPDPGDSFLGTHPANADRIATVQRVAAGG